MPVNLAIISTDCVLGLNAGSGYSATVTDPRWSTQQIVDAVLNSDGMVVAACIEDRNNPYASGYYTLISGIPNGSTVTASLGPIVSIQFNLTGGSPPSVRPGILWDLAEIIDEIQNPNGLNYDPHFQLQGRILYHNGASIAAVETATVSVNAMVINFVRSSACQAPDVFAWLVFVGAMAQLVPVEGENVGASANWAQMFFQGLQAVREGKNLQPVGYEDFVRQQLGRAA
jgi:hypothetical protein